MKESNPARPAIDGQIGGTHYRDMVIQPVVFSQLNGLGFCEANVVKYVCRHRAKGGAEDIRKAIHYLELLLEIEYPAPLKGALEKQYTDDNGNVIAKARR